MTGTAGLAGGGEEVGLAGPGAAEAGAPPGEVGRVETGAGGRGAGAWLAAGAGGLRISGLAGAEGATTERFGSAGRGEGAAAAGRTGL